MSAISLRLPESLHATARKVAKEEQISLNQLITIALAEKLSALITEDYLKERAGRGDKEKFVQAMAQVADIEPEDYDRL